MDTDLNRMWYYREVFLLAKSNDNAAPQRYKDRFPAASAAVSSHPKWLVPSGANLKQDRMWVISTKTINTAKSWEISLQQALSSCRMFIDIIDDLHFQVCSVRAGQSCGAWWSICDHGLNSLYGDGDLTPDRNPYTGHIKYINPCSWVDDHPPPLWQNGSFRT